jgi:hypothetical protein
MLIIEKKLVEEMKIDDNGWNETSITLSETLFMDEIKSCPQILH